MEQVHFKNIRKSTRALALVIFLSFSIANVSSRPLSTEDLMTETVRGGASERLLNKLNLGQER